jgi:hypothetical protein
MQLAKKKPNVLSNAIFKLFVIKNPFQKDDVQNPNFKPSLFNCEE